jgi:GlpG protein
MTWVRFITHIFGHSGWGHFMGNMTYILLLGPLLEEKHGSGMTIRVILVTALVTALLSYILFPGTALCGASGVVFAFIILASFTGFSSGEIPLTFLLVAAIFIGQQVVEGVFTRDNISQLSHIAGGLVGACMGFAFGRRR